MVISSPRKRAGGAALYVALGIFLSRISGLVRERVFAYYFANSEAAGAFKAALRIPNFLQNLFGEGVLSASFIPVYSKLLAEQDEAAARRVAGVVVSVLILGVSVMVLAGVLLTPAFVDIVAPGFTGELRELTIRIVRVLFPGVGLLVISAWCLGVLNSHRKFFLSYVATVFWNFAMIATLVFFGRRSAPSDLAVDLAWGSVVGSALQLGSQLPFVFRYAGPIRTSLDLTLRPVREVFRNSGPVLVSRGVVQLSAYIDGMIASFLGASAVSSLGYAQTIYLLPISLFGMSVAAAELPEMSSSTGDSNEISERIRQRILFGRGNIAFFVVPTVVAFLFLGRSVVSALYQTGAFGAQDTLYVWYILMGSVVGLLATTWGRLYSSAFYALRDTKTPLYFAIVRVTLTAVLGILFAFPLRPAITGLLTGVFGLPTPGLPGIDLGLGAIGLTASAGMAGWIEFLLLRRALGRRIGSTAVDVSFLIRVWTAALLAGLLAWGVDRFILSVLGVRFRFLHYDWKPVLVVAVFGIAYLMLCIGMKIPHATQLASRFLRMRRN